MLLFKSLIFSAFSVFDFFEKSYNSYNMKDFFIQNNNLLGAIASLGAIITLFFVYLAALASRKQNVLTTIPLLTLEYKDENQQLYIRNLNDSFAYRFKSEPYIHINLDKSPLSLAKTGKTIYKLSLKDGNFIAPNDERKELKVLAGNEEVKMKLWHYLFSILLNNKSGINLFYRDSQNHRFITRVRSRHDDKTINNNVVFEIVSSPRYMPNYAIHLWIQYSARTVSAYAQSTDFWIRLRGKYIQLKQSLYSSID